MPVPPSPAGKGVRGLGLFAICILQFSICNSPAFAVRPYTPVHPDPVLEPWRWRAFPELKGLGLRCMAEAKDKAMWFGVDDGARRYDGVKWSAYTEKDGLYGAPVNVLCATRDGSVYAGTPMGISQFREGKWTRVFPPEGDPSTSSGQALPWSVFDLMEARDGSLWAGTMWGALRIGQGDTTLFTTKDMGNALRVLAPDVRLSIVPDAAVPARPYGEGIGVAIVPVGAGEKVPKYIYALAPGGSGEAAGLKVGDRIVALNGQPVTGAVAGALDGPAATTMSLTVQRQRDSEPFEVTLICEQVGESYRNFNVFDVCEGWDGAIWFGLYQGEIIRCDLRAPLADEDAWSIFTEADGLEVGLRPRIAQTRDGSVWTISETITSGINRFDGKRWTSIPRRYIDTSILETQDGALWIGREPVPVVLRDTTWTAYGGLFQRIPWHRPRLLEASDGAVWIAGLGQEAARLDYRTSHWTTYEGLTFQCGTPDGAQWFISNDDGVVSYDGRTWTRHGTEDGLMAAPYRLISTRQGVLWAAGSHHFNAATARFDGKRWHLQTHPRLSWGVEPGVVYEAADGSLWFGAGQDTDKFRERGYLGGVLRYNERGWTHHTPPDVAWYAYGIGQSADGAIWLGGGDLRRFDGEKWTVATEPEELAASWTHVLYTAPDGDLWVGSRAYGVFRYDGRNWTRYDVRDGLASNSVTRLGGILQTKDSSIWVATEGGVSRFKASPARGGRTWTSHTLPAMSDAVAILLQQSRDGAVWNSATSRWWLRDKPGASRPRGFPPLRAVRYEPDTLPPETRLNVSLDRVSQPGNTVLSWVGVDPWFSAADAEVQYSHRLDGGEWSPFSKDTHKTFFELPSGRHTFEVKARDRDFNEDPTSAAVTFTVVPPVWQEPWFIGLVLAFVGITGFQASRIVIRDRKLREANAALSSANKGLFGLNRELQQKTEDLEKANAQVQEGTERKSRFLASMSHELRTPMNAIIGFTRLVLRREGDRLSERQRENLVKVQQASDHLLSLINDILDLSKVEAGRVEVKPAPFDVKGLIASCCSTVNPLVRPGVALNYEVTDGVGEAHTDEARLRQIVINLLSNALKFTESGEVKVRVARPPTADRRPPPSISGPPSSVVGRPSEDGFLEIAVSDTGVGIPADSLGLIFEEFRQVAGAHQTQKGTGLGLAITKKLTELLGGTICVASEVGKGSTFTVRVPLVYKERQGG